ncbi:MAG: CocE/NonD family hydrolase [Thermostichus sp. DG02_3_bins_51]
MLPVRPRETVSMFTRDGIQLDADVYRPQAEGTYPVLLMRQPYGRSIASTVVYAHPRWYAAQGYIVVIQDVRGRGTSKGSFYPFRAEADDGFDTVNWAATLPGSNGSVGMYGFSYQGMTQLYAASTRPVALKTLCPAMMPYDLYADAAYEGGAFRFQSNLGWAIQLEAEGARLRGDANAYQALFKASRNLPLYDPIPVKPGVLQQYAPQSYYFDWLEHPEQDDYWRKLSPHLEAVDLPMLHIAGWFDSYLTGNIRLYKEMVARSQNPQHLIIGPWSHLLWGRRVGTMDFGPAAVSPIDRLQIRWFDQFLKGKDTGILQELPVQLFEMGSNRWRGFETWPTPQPQFFYLQSSGLAALSEAEGSLQPEPCAEAQSDTFVHDPWRPVPALGGHLVHPPGPQERSALDCRTDILTYTTPPLETDWVLAGELSLELYVEADSPSFDLCAVISDVRPDGQVYTLTQGYRRVQNVQPNTPITLECQPTCIRIPRGHALRLSLSGACFPAYPVNTGTGSPVREERLVEARIVTLTLHSGGDTCSRLLLPLV